MLYKMTLKDFDYNGKRVLSRVDRAYKYNQLLPIKDELDETAIFHGKDVFHNLR